MKILIFTSVFPYPLDEGGKVAQFGFLECLCREHEVVLVAENNYEQTLRDASELNKILPELTIKTLIPYKPNENKGITAFLLKWIKKIEWRLKRRLALKGARTSSIADNNFFVHPVGLRKNEIITQLLEIVGMEKPDIIQIDFIDNADLACVLPFNIPKVLILHDLRFASVRLAAELEGRSKNYAKYLSSYVSTTEAAFSNKFDSIITFSIDDKNKLLPLLHDTKVVSIPFSVSDKNISEIDNSAYSIQKLIFIGPEHHIPNYDAVKWYAETMSQDIFKEFNLKLFVIGKWSIKAIDSFSKYTGIEFAGFVDDIKAISKNSVMLVPLRIGSGIRTKLLEAFSYGIPVISTSIGCEGLGIKNEQELLVAETPEEFIESIQKLLTNSGLANSFQNAANEFVRKNFSQKNIYNKRIRVYEQLVNKELV